VELSDISVFARMLSSKEVKGLTEIFLPLFFFLSSLSFMPSLKLIFLHVVFFLFSFYLNSCMTVYNCLNIFGFREEQKTALRSSLTRSTGFKLLNRVS